MKARNAQLMADNERYLKQLNASRIDVNELYCLELEVNVLLNLVSALLLTLDTVVVVKQRHNLNFAVGAHQNAIFLRYFCVVETVFLRAYKIAID